jgi:hypothetical protein
MRRRSSPVADWIAVLLQMPLGFFAGISGFVAGLYVCGRAIAWLAIFGPASQRLDVFDFDLGWINPQTAVPVILLVAGAGLIGAGAAARYGDRLWLGPGSRAIPLSEIRPDLPKKRLAFVTGGLGVLLMAIGAVAVMIAQVR